MAGWVLPEGQSLPCPSFRATTEVKKQKVKAIKPTKEMGQNVLVPEEGRKREGKQRRDK